jgi:hypothetical protein
MRLHTPASNDFFFIISGKCAGKDFGYARRSSDEPLLAALEMDEDDAILLAALEMAERQRAERAGPWQLSAGRAPPERLSEGMIVCEDSGSGFGKWGGDGQRTAARPPSCPTDHRALPDPGHSQQGWQQDNRARMPHAATTRGELRARPAPAAAAAVCPPMRALPGLADMGLPLPSHRDISRLQQQRLPFAPSGARPEAQKPSLLAQNAATLAYEREVQARCKAAAAAQRHDQEIERQKALMHGAPGGAMAGGRVARCGEAPARSQSLLCPKAPAVHVRPALLLEHDRTMLIGMTPAGLAVDKAKTLYMPSFGREYQR